MISLEIIMGVAFFVELYTNFIRLNSTFTSQLYSGTHTYAAQNGYILIKLFFCFHLRFFTRDKSLELDL